MNYIKPIGGYFQVELNEKKEWFNKLIKVNSGRNALEYILRTGGYKKIFLPYYTCDAVLQPIIKQGLKHEFYSINENLEPVTFKKIKKDEAFLYTNYFGVKTEFIKSLKGKNIIIDNAQAFFDKPVNNFSTFYSPRKFFGVPSGGYAFIKNYMPLSLEQDTSVDGMGHLFLRKENRLQEGYEVYLRNEERFSRMPLQRMSNTVIALLSQINYSKVLKKRNENFEILHNKLSKHNLLNLHNNINGPMVYPLRCKLPKLREKLINEKVFVATYWDSVNTYAPAKSLETCLVNELIPLPVDQRLDITDMNKIIDIIMSEL